MGPAVCSSLIITSRPGDRPSTVANSAILTAMEPSPNSPHVVLADPLADKEVLALAALAWCDEERPLSWREIRAAAEADPKSVVLLAARLGDRLVAALVAHTLPGRAAVVWPPQVVDEAAVSLSGSMLRQLVAMLQERG